jgi:hypothetical protein
MEIKTRFSLKNLEDKSSLNSKASEKPTVELL